MKKYLVICSVGLALGISGTAMAEPQQGKFMKFFDANQDGTVTMEEFETSARARFERMDADKNGKVSLEEWQSGFKYGKGSCKKGEAGHHKCSKEESCGKKGKKAVEKELPVM